MAAGKFYTIDPWLEPFIYIIENVSEMPPERKGT